MTADRYEERGFDFQKSETMLWKLASLNTTDTELSNSKQNQHHALNKQNQQQTNCCLLEAAFQQEEECMCFYGLHFKGGDSQEKIKQLNKEVKNHFTIQLGKNRYRFPLLNHIHIHLSHTQAAGYREVTWGLRALVSLLVKQWSLNIKIKLDLRWNT